MKSMSKSITEMTSCVRLKIVSEREVLLTSLLGIAAWGVATYLERFFLPMTDGVTPTRFVIAALLIIGFLILAFWRKHSLFEWLGISVVITAIWVALYALVAVFSPERLPKKDWWFEAGTAFALFFHAVYVYLSTLLAIAVFKTSSTVLFALYRFLLKNREKRRTEKNIIMKLLSKLITEMIWHVRLKIASEREVFITSLLGLAAWGVAIYLVRFFLPMADGVTPTRFVMATLLIITFLALAFWRRHSFYEWLGVAFFITAMWLFFYVIIGVFFPEWLHKKDWWFEAGPTYAVFEYAETIYLFTLYSIFVFKTASTVLLALYRLFLNLRRKHSRRGVAV